MLIVASASPQEALSLVPLARYRFLSGDTTSSDQDVTDALVEAVELIEDYLRRKLANGLHTESLLPVRGKVYPSCKPITAVAEFDVLEGAAISLGLQPRAGTAAVVEYEGGWTAQNIPRTILIAIVETAHELLSSAQSAGTAPAGTYGARNLSVGDVSVFYAEGGGVGVGSGGLPSRVRRSIKKWQTKYL